MDLRTPLREASQPLPGSITIRRPQVQDAPALVHLAALDSQRLPSGPLLVAEVDDELWAAVSLTTTQIVADPYRPTADLQALLTARARQLRRDARPTHSRTLIRRHRASTA
jgi:hypothetical protein